MRQVISRFLKHLDAEKNASLSTIQSYRYDLNKFDDYYRSTRKKVSTRGCFSRSHSRLSPLALRGRSSKAKRSLGSCPRTWRYPVVFQICPSCRSTKG